MITMPHESLTDIMTTIRRLAHSPHEAERLARFIVLEMILLAVILGLLNRPSKVPEDSTTGPGNSRKKPEPQLFSLPIPARAAHSPTGFSLD